MSQLEVIHSFNFHYEINKLMTADEKVKVIESVTQDNPGDIKKVSDTIGPVSVKGLIQLTESCLYKGEGRFDADNFEAIYNASTHS